MIFVQLSTQQHLLITKINSKETCFSFSHEKSNNLKFDTNCFGNAVVIVCEKQ